MITWVLFSAMWIPRSVIRFYEFCLAATPFGPIRLLICSAREMSPLDISLDSTAISFLLARLAFQAMVLLVGIATSGSCDLALSRRAKIPKTFLRAV